jgi:PTH1 family peptidyl-tRNA hydrolase
VILGLGNPGARYAATRHNAGFLALDRLAAREGLRFLPGRGDWFAARWARARGDALLVKPTTFMNRSGEAGAALVGATALAPGRFLVVVDDVELPLGRLRLRGRGSSGGHRGLDSLIAQWGDDAFPRLRLGVGPRRGGMSDFVLQPFGEEELDTLDAMLDAAADAILAFLDDGLERAMNRFNAFHTQ